MPEYIAILDFGSQYTKLIARRIRELGVKSLILPFDTTAKRIKTAKGLILSGGPFSVYDPKAPLPDKEIFDLGLPILGICYGLQAIGHLLGGKVVQSQKREYGMAYFVKKKDEIFYGIPRHSSVWMSHGDRLEVLPQGFTPIGFTENSPYAAIKRENIYGLQFHPEVVHTTFGTQILKNFLYRVCKARGEWGIEGILMGAEKELKKAKDGRAILALSGGVDSTVCAVLSKKILGERVFPVLVDTGLLRHREAEFVEKSLDKIGVEIKVVDASQIFIDALKGVKDPEKKRKIIGHKFIEVFEREAKKVGAKYLIQGTLYPDRIESAGVPGPSKTIKSHHNVGGLPKLMNLQIVEPLKELFKDEVRMIAKALKLPKSLYMRHPFPGPGLAIRIIGNVTQRKLKILKMVDEIYINELKRHKLYDKIWQAFAVLLPTKTVGVMGDYRTYEYVVALRAVCSSDGMTADFYPFKPGFLTLVSNKILNRVKGVNRVVFDISSKPPATIEWE